MAGAAQDKKFWIGRGLLGVLFLFAGWLYYQLDLNYRNLEDSNKAVDSMLDKQAAQVQRYAGEGIVTKKKIAETEALVAQLKQENENLLKQEEANKQENDRMRGKMAEMEANVADLKEKNLALLGQIEKLENDALLHPERVKSLAEGKGLISRFKERLRNMDRRMKELKHDVFVAKVEAQQELDKKRSLAGNNGFLVRNGMAMPIDIVLPSVEDKVKVDVKFVK
jgi:hypothetical protein